MAARVVERGRSGRRPLAHAAVAQEQVPELTPAGKAALKDVLAAYAGRPAAPPLANCNFRGGLSGAVRGDGTVAVPRARRVGRFSEDRAAVRLGGLYGFNPTGTTTSTFMWDYRNRTIAAWVSRGNERLRL